jgi:opacity protein-like surface antigen
MLVQAPILLILSLTLIGQAQAELFVDIYGGWSKARATDVSATQKTCFVVGCTGTIQTTQQQHFSSGTAAGLRGGYWFEASPWLGLGADGSYYQTSSTQVSLDSFAAAVTPLIRLPLWTTPEQPHGHLQPYAGGGPALVFHSVSADFHQESSVSVSGWSAAVGWTVRGGLAVPISDHLALFGEWRLSQDRVSLHQNGFFGLGNRSRLDMIQTTQQTLFGLSCRF